MRQNVEASLESMQPPILPAMLCHAFVNGAVNVWRVAVKFGDIPKTIQTVFLAASLLVGLICFVLLVRRFASSGPE